MLPPERFERPSVTHCNTSKERESAKKRAKAVNVYRNRSVRMREWHVLEGLSGENGPDVPA